MFMLNYFQLKLRKSNQNNPKVSNDVFKVYFKIKSQALVASNLKNFLRGCLDPATEVEAVVQPRSGRMSRPHFGLKSRQFSSSRPRIPNVSVRRYLFQHKGKEMLLLLLEGKQILHINAEVVITESF